MQNQSIGCRAILRRAPAAAAAARRRRGFSLVELLIAVGILATLAGMLLPAVGRARYKGRVVLCAARIRQLSLAVHQYAVKNDGYFPGTDMPGTGLNLWDVSNEFCGICLPPSAHFLISDARMQLAWTHRRT